VQRTWEFLSTWTFEPVLAIGLLAAAGAYLYGVLRVNKKTPLKRWPWYYTLFFYSGLGAIVLVTFGPIGAYDDELFWAHMTQHIIFMMVAAPLILLGQPVLLLLRASSREFRSKVALPVLRSRVVRFLTNPFVTWILFAGVLVAAHFTGFYEYALDHTWVHNYVEHTMYLGVALLYFYPLLGIGPSASAMKPFAKVVSLFLMMLPEAMVGFAIYMAKDVLYPHYSTVTDRILGPGTALSDQRLGGAFMWSSAMIFNAIWISYAAWQWIKSEELKSRRVDREIAAEIAAEAQSGS
jgi:putative copper resistance protein D